MAAVAQVMSDIGKRLKVLREAANRRQEDVAAAAQSCGIGWKRSTVAMFESGRYELKADELLLLPRILHLAGVADLSLRALLMGEDDELTVTETCRIGSAELGKLFGRQPASKVGWSSSLPDDEDADTSAGVGSTSAGLLKLAASGQAMPPSLRTHAVWRGLNGEAEAKAARKFEVDISEVVNTSIDLWTRSLSDERDQRVDQAIEDGGLDVSPRTIQAFRAHTTRALLKELAKKLAGEEEEI